MRGHMKIREGTSSLRFEAKNQEGQRKTGEFNLVYSGLK